MGAHLAGTTHRADGVAMSHIDERFEVRSVYGAKTRQPLVTVVIGEHMITITPSKAREMASMLYDCAASAEADAFLVEWLQSAISATPEQTALMLQMFRDYKKG